ncbi:transferrin-binding protein-like solute binding protein [Neisseria sp. S1]|uniref:transferrin-binding protein-like solute binding protein n=1 Tax=Neisseria sp. S1 TaxID=3318354 RepID=UPI003A8B0A80
MQPYLTACGGGGGGSGASGTSLNTELLANAREVRQVMDQIEALPSAEDLTVEHTEALKAVLNNYTNLSNAQKSLVPKASRDKLLELLKAAESLAQNNNVGGNTADTNLDSIEDNNSLPALNLPVPLHTHFIKSESAQQHNPHMQLRKVDGKPALVDTQIGLIRSLILDLDETGRKNKNELVIVDGVVFFTDKQHQQLTYSTPNVGIIKSSSVGSSDYNGDISLKAEVDTLLNNLNYIKKDHNGLMFDKAVDGVYVLKFANGVSMVIHDPAAAGWTYQTFTHYIDAKNGITHGYQSLGDETGTGAMPTSGTATYKGISTAYLVNKEGNHQLTSKVTAVADFAKKGIRFATSDSQIHKAQNGIRVSTPADKYNLTGTAKWGNNENSFKGTVNTADNTLSGTLNGKFYGGASVAEIGGTYGLSGKEQQLIGGYGAKRQ